MAKKSEELSTLEEFINLLACVCTLGGIWVCKIVIKKAMIESR